MTIIMRPWRDETNLPLIVDLLRSVSPASRHLVDIPWRLSSPALQNERNARVWVDNDGRMIGFATWQIYWAVLDYFVRPLTDLLPEPTLPNDFTIRPIDGEREGNAYVELHRAAFESTSMTYDWRLRTLHMPQYQPELDIVAVAPDGSLAGFCVGWLNAERHTG